MRLHHAFEALPKERSAAMRRFFAPGWAESLRRLKALVEEGRNVIA